MNRQLSAMLFNMLLVLLLLTSVPVRGDDVTEEGGGGWSAWGEWSACSRACDGGVSSQARRCHARQGCRGESLRHRICSMQPCAEQHDFRSQQCSAYNSVPYHGALYEWVPHDDPSDPCSLTCRAKGQQQGGRLVAQLYPKVLDGTRCREGALDMCINGKCQPVGCDLQLGSTKKVDACGVCGGDGATCGRPSYYWESTPMSACSATCGGGVQTSLVTCRNRKSGEGVDEHFCDVTTRPAPATRHCNPEKCPPAAASAAWTSGEWSSCSATCGGGFQERRVVCSDTGGATDDARCVAKRPKDRRACAVDDCPRWHEAPWSGCSVTCGEGFQTRHVTCRGSGGDCDASVKPETRQPCTTGFACSDVDDKKTFSAILRPYPSPQGQHKVTGTHLVASEPSDYIMYFGCGWVTVSFVPEAWGACSVACGEGVRRRDVRCKIFLEFSRTVAILPDKECPGAKPAEVERCVARPCALNRLAEPVKSEDEVASNAIVTYSWRQAGFSPCSASCLGGVRESVVQCVRDHDGATVSPFLCDVARKPDVITQTCHDRPCPPRWNASAWDACSRTCGGGGAQARRVACVHDVTRGVTLQVPSALCLGPDGPPVPRARQACNVVDCRPRWVAGPWTKCSERCGGGAKSRQVACKQVLASGALVPRPERSCPVARVPLATKRCNIRPCGSSPPGVATDIRRLNQTYVQQSPLLRQVALRVGGSATVFKGTRLKIRCPVRRRSDRAKVKWAKDHAFVSSSRKLAVGRSGTLRIRSAQFSDGGVYTCLAGRDSANLTLVVRPPPPLKALGGAFDDDDDDRTVERPRHSVEHVAPSRSRPNAAPKLHTLEEDDDDDEEVAPPVVVPDASFSHENTWSRLPPRKATRPLTKSGAVGSDNSLEVNMKNFDTWEFQHGGGPAAAFYSDGLAEDDDDDERPLASTLPHLRDLLLNLQSTFVPPPPGGAGFISDDALASSSSFVLGKGKAENLKFDWMLSAWSACSRTCGGSGFQVRVTQCMVALHNVTKTVDNALCKDAGLDPPVSFRVCGVADCPRWVAAAWAACEHSSCVAWNTAQQRRRVTCVAAHNATRLADAACDPAARPREKRECYNTRCRGEWKVGNWSECLAACDGSGFRSRLLKCVWFGTERPAGNACREQPRPTVHEACAGPPCSSSSAAAAENR